MPSGSARTTLATVAASAGVSVATVSKVINGRTDVSPTTRARVQALLRQHDYVSRRVPAGGTPSIALLFQNDLNAYMTEIMNGALDAAADLTVSVVVSVLSLAKGTSEPTDWAKDVIAAGRKAVVAVTTELTASDVGALSRARLPLVVVNPLTTPHARLTSVGSTDFSGGIAATNHLLALGHRKIGYIGGAPLAPCNQARMAGFRSAMHAAGAPVIEEYLRSEQEAYDDGVASGAELMDLRDRPTALLAFNDEVALGVLEAARTRGLRVPAELSVVGFDDTQMARLSSPPLTTVRQPLREMGAVALRTAVQLSAGARVDFRHIELATELVVRGSTAQPDAP
ncbi:LacI family DNA-binding transcriptional regulator [Angustibacter luteus]|uniref:LacI family DNA-binding transcriptional regulator n=1 Tax=Angustibacter luteus TaxID=658456 RepID=A0ABW1JE02_9ACTN